MNGIAKMAGNLIATRYQRVLSQVQWYDTTFINAPLTAMGQYHLRGTVITVLDSPLGPEQGLPLTGTGE